jgi:hypothetical protein
VSLYDEYSSFKVFVETQHKIMIINFSLDFPEKLEPIISHIISSTTYSKYIIPFCTYPCISYLHCKNPTTKIFVQTDSGISLFRYSQKNGVYCVNHTVDFIEEWDYFDDIADLSLIELSNKE